MTQEGKCDSTISRGKTNIPSIKIRMDIEKIQEIPLKNNFLEKITINTNDFVSISRIEYLELIHKPKKVIKNKKNGIIMHLSVDATKMRMLSEKLDDNKILK